MLGVARSNLVERIKGRPRQRVGRPPAPADDLAAEIGAVVGEPPTYGHRRVHALPRRRALAEGRQPPNHERVSRAMEEHGLPLRRRAGGAGRRHDGRIAVDRSDLRRCSDAFEVVAENGERVRVAFALDRCGREAVSLVATTGGIGGGGVRDLMAAAVEHRFGRVNRPPQPVEWPTDNGSGYVATETRRFARDPGSEPCTTPVGSPQSNGVAEAFVRTIERDYVRVSPVPDARSVPRQLPAWMAHHDEIHPHKAPGYRSPREFIATRSTP